MKESDQTFSCRTISFMAISIFLFALSAQTNIWAQQQSLCLDGFCIGQTIQNSRFDNTEWLIPKKDLIKTNCTGIGCQPGVEFRGYPRDEQEELSQALSLEYGLNAYNLITNQSLGILRKYRYDCNQSARGIWGQRRFVGLYLSTPSRYLTVVGLRLMNGELIVYRIARQFPYHNQNELISRAKEIRDKYGSDILLYDGISSNAPYDVIKQGKDGWFGRSTTFNPRDLSDNAAELVLIDPRTRTLLQPTSMPDSGEISAVPVRLSSACNSSTPLQ